MIDKSKLFLPVVFLGALLLRLAIGAYFGDFENPEMYEHGKIARNLLERGEFAMHWPYPSQSEARLAEQEQAPPRGAFIPPLNPYVLFLGMKTFGDGPAGYVFLTILNAFLGALAIFPSFYIAKNLFSRRAGAIAAIIAAGFLPAAYGVITYSGSQTYHLAALYSILFAIKFSLKPDFGSALLLGLFCALQTLVRSEFLLLAFAFLGVSALAAKLRAGKAFKFSQLVLASAVFAAIVAPWSVRNYSIFDKFVPIVSHPRHEIWRGNNPKATGGSRDSDGEGIWLSEKHGSSLIPKLDSLEYDEKFEIRADSIFGAEAKKFISKNPGKFVELGAKRVLFFWTVDPFDSRTWNPIYMFFAGFILVGTVIGSIRLLFGRNLPILKNPYLIYLTFFAYYTALMFAVNLESRYQVYLFTVCVPIVGVGADYVYSIIRKKRAAGV